MAPITAVIVGVPRRRALCRNLLEREHGIAVAAEVGGALEVRAAVARLRPSVVLLDAGLGRLDALAVLPGIRHQHPSTKVLVLTADATPDALILEALKRGAQGYLAESSLPAYLAKAIRKVHLGEPWVPRRMVAKILDQLVRLAALEQGIRAVGLDRPARPGGARRAARAGVAAVNR